MNTQGIDLLEVILKEHLQIPLTELEENFLNIIDDEAKEAALLLINSSAFVDEITSLSDSIIKKASQLSQEQQDYIKMKCQKKIEELENSTPKPKSSETSDKSLKKC